MMMQTAGTQSYATTSDPNKIVVYAWKGGQNWANYKAEQAQWRVQWCAVGRK
jgi:hypothetical protein